MDQNIKDQIRKVRGKFIAMAVTYCLGVFNDSFFRQSAILIAAGAATHIKDMQGYVMALFALPYLLFAAPSGWLADRFPKSQVIIFAKILELVAMIFGAIGIYTESWPFILVMVFIMGAQSCIFSPSLNGSIPELYPESYVIRINAILKLVVTASILSGVAFSGIALDEGRGVVAAGVIIISALGVIFSFGVARRPAAAPEKPFPLRAIINTIEDLYATRKDKLLFLVIASESFLWMSGSLIILLINEMVKSEFSGTNTMASAIVATELIGIAIGGFLATILATGKGWHRVLAPSMFCMGIFLSLMFFIPSFPYPITLSFFLLGFVGIAGGLILIPCESFVQIRPTPDRKGQIIAAANFAIFFGIVLSGPLFNYLNHLLPRAQTTCFCLLGLTTIVISLLMFVFIPSEDKRI